MFFLKERRIDKLLEEIKPRNKIKELSYLFLGCLIVAIAFNIFFLPNNLVCFGVSGLSIVAKKFGIDPIIFIFFANVLLLGLSFIFLGANKTKNSVIGSLIFPIFIYLTKFLVPYVSLDGVEMLVIAIFGAVIAGTGFGLIFKTEYTTGGTDIVSQIFAKYLKVSPGNTKFFADGIVVLLGLVAYSWKIFFYGIIILYIIGLMIDKMILGISSSKAFYITTGKEDEVRKFLLSTSDAGVTLLKARGGYSNDRKSLLLAVVPTRQYFYVKERLKLIDEDIFFLVCDAYEVNRKEQVLEMDAE